RCDQIAGDALRNEKGVEGDFGVTALYVAGRAHRHARKPFDATTDGHVALAAHPLRRGEVACVEAPGAEAGDLDAGHLFLEAGVENRDAGNVGTLLAARLDHTEHDVVDEAGAEVRAVADRLEGGRRQLDRGN